MTAAHPRGPHGPAGQVAIEFALAATAFLVLLLGTMDAAISSFERTMVDYRISTIADNLPDGYDSLSDADLVRDALCDREGLDPDRLTVVSADVEPVDHDPGTGPDALAGELGSENATRRQTRLEIKAKITYDVSGIGILSTGDYTREFDQTVTLTRRYEIS